MNPHKPGETQVNIQIYKDPTYSNSDFKMYFKIQDPNNKTHTEKFVFKI